MQRILAVSFLVMLLAACSLVPVYKPAIEQGNIFDQAMIDKLKPGMNKEQILYVMGTPVLRHDFFPNRWDYVYSLKRGDDKFFLKRVSLYFRGDKLKEIKQSYPNPPGQKQLPLPIELEQGKPLDFEKETHAPR